MGSLVQDDLIAVDSQIMQLVSYTKSHPNDAIAWGKLAVVRLTHICLFHTFLFISTHIFYIISCIAYIGVPI